MNKLLRLSFAGLLLLAGCTRNNPDPSPPQLYGSTWNLTQQTVIATDPGGITTTVTTTVPAGALSYQFPGNGTYKLITATATADGPCEYDGKTITLQNTVGSSPTRVLKVSTLTTSQLVTVEDNQTSAGTYHTTSTFTR
jgi:hypothetical protein